MEANKPRFNPLPIVITFFSSSISFIKRLPIFESSSDDESHINAHTTNSINSDEADNESGHRAAARSNPEAEEEWTRTRDFTQGVGLGTMGVSVTLIVNMPPAAPAHRVLYTGYIVVTCLGLLAGTGLVFYSMAKKRCSREVAWVQERLMALALVFVALACLLRLIFALPIEYLAFGLLSIFIAVNLAVVYLCTARRCDCARVGDIPARG